MKNTIQILDFWAPYCPPCRAFKPTFEKWAEKYGDRADFVQVDVSDDDNVESVQRFKISSIPTVVVLKDGEEVERFQGAPPLAKLAPYLKQ